jgi:polyisoprenoid-binding protein YceI
MTDSLPTILVERALRCFVKFGDPQCVFAPEMMGRHWDYSRLTENAMRARLHAYLSVLMMGLLLVPLTAQAAWRLVSDRSQINYTTTKIFPGAAKSAAENNRFARLDGHVDDDGSAEVLISLDSVATNIAIRDERMRKLVFETERYPAAAVTSQVPVGTLDTPGLHQIDLTLQLDLHGAKKAMTVPVSVVSSGDLLMVSSMSPVLIQAEDFGLVSGLQELTKIAGLMYIPTTVPVSFSLVFQKQ